MANRRKIAQVGSIRIIRDYEWQQYICSPVGAKNDDADYFTDDLEDARNTAAAMDRHFQQHQPKEHHE